MEVEFLKLQFAGNDFICLETDKNQQLEEKHLGSLAKKICDRHFGVGGEGLIFLSVDEVKQMGIRVFTPAGKEREECGAALQCAARYAFDSGLVTEKEFIIFIGDRKVKLEIVDSSNVREDLGVPLTLDKKTELKELSDTTYTKPLVIENHEYSCTPIMLDMAHAILFVSTYNLPLHQLARKIDNDPLFPEGTNVSFVRVFSREELQVRAWMSGGNELLACPKVASASLIAAALNGFAEREALVHLRGGDLFVEWDETTNHVFSTGPSEYTFSGNFYFEE